MAGADPRFAQAAAALGLQDAEPEQVEQAAKFWEMMDDMARENPDGYQRFIGKQMKEREDFLKNNAAPTPKFLAKCTDTHTGNVVWMNFSGSDRVKPQIDNNAAINIVVQEPSNETSEGGKILLYEIVFHPDVLQKFDEDDEFKAQAIQLGLDCVEQRAKKLFDAKTKGVHIVRFQRDTLTLRTKPFKKKDLMDIVDEAKRRQQREAGNGFDMKMPGEDGGPPTPAGHGSADAAAVTGSAVPPMPEIIVPGIGKDNGKDDASAAEIGALKTLLPQTAGTANTPARKPVIEVVAEQGGGGGDGGGDHGTGGGGPTTPVYACVKNSDSGCFEVRVELPLVGSVAEIELDVAEKSLSLTSGELYTLEIALATTVDPDAVTAKFKKKLHCLLLTLPFK